MGWHVEQVLDPTLPPAARGTWEKPLTCYGPQFVQFEKRGRGLDNLYSYLHSTTSFKFLRFHMST